MERGLEPCGAGRCEWVNGLSGEASLRCRTGLLWCRRSGLLVSSGDWPRTRLVMQSDMALGEPGTCLFLDDGRLG
jgi:hypothetical protein